MIENIDVLLSVAEISVAFAGFAGIITAVAGRSDGGWDPGNLTRFRLMITSSLAATIMSLMPYIFLLNSDQINWNWSVGILGVFLFFLSALWIRSFVIGRKNLNNYVSFGVGLMAVSATLVQFVALFGFVVADLGIYFLGVFCLFILSCVAFFRLVTEAILRPASAD